MKWAVSPPYAQSAVGAKDRADWVTVAIPNWSVEHPPESSREKLVGKSIRAEGTLVAPAAAAPHAK